MSGHMKKLRMMLAESDPLSRSLLRSSLAYWGCDVITAQNEAQACTALSAGNIDLCILSWDADGQNALRICEWLRQANLKSDPQVIVLLENCSTENIQAAYRAGAKDFILKPLRVEDVRVRISAIAQKLIQRHCLPLDPEQLDPLEFYRMDLATHSKTNRGLQ